MLKIIPLPLIIVFKYLQCLSESGVDSFDLSTVVEVYQFVLLRQFWVICGSLSKGMTISLSDVADGSLLLASAVADGFNFSPPDCKNFRFPTHWFFAAGVCFCLGIGCPFDPLSHRCGWALIVTSSFLSTYVLSTDFKF